MNKIKLEILNCLKPFYGVNNVKIYLTDYQYGDYAINAPFVISKQNNISPYSYYETVRNDLMRCEYIDEVTFLNGYINVRLNGHKLAETILDDEVTLSFEKKSETNKLVLIEAMTHNLSKPFSIEDFRSASYGMTIKKLLERTNCDVITDNHFCDYSIPFGIFATGYELLSNETMLKNNGIYELERISNELRKKLKFENIFGETKLARTVEMWDNSLINGDSKAKEYYDLFYDIMLNHMHSVMKKIGVFVDSEHGETLYIEDAKKIVDDCIKNKLAEVTLDNTVIVDLKNAGIETPIILRKSSGKITCYSIDLATMLRRKKTYNPHTYIYCSNENHQLYFQKIFTFADDLGIKENKYLLSYSNINIQNYEKIKSDDCDTIYFEDILQYTKNYFCSLFNDINDEDVLKYALGAIRFQNFSQSFNKCYTISFDSLFSKNSFNAFTIQNCIIKIKDIINNSKVMETDSVLLDDCTYENEKRMLLKVYEYKELISKISINYHFNSLTNYLYELSQIVNQYIKDTSGTYNNFSIICLLKKVLEVFIDGLDILGIDIPERML